MAALEQNVYRDVSGFRRLVPVEKREIDTSSCQQQDRECRVDVYSGAGIDIVLFGVLEKRETDPEADPEAEPMAKYTVAGPLPTAVLEGRPALEFFAARRVASFLMTGYCH